MLAELDKRFKMREALLKPFLIKTDPLLLTLLGVLCAFGAGYAFYKDFIHLAIVFVIANGFFDILDGAVARKYGKASKRGDFLDHTLDRAADVAIFAGVALNPRGDLYAGFALIIVMMIFSYIGAVSQGLLGKRLYDGIGGRADRLFIIALFGIASLFVPVALYYGTYVVLILLLLGTVERFIHVYRKLG